MSAAQPDSQETGLYFRVHQLEENHSRHDAALGRIGSAVDHVQGEVHEIRVTLRERDKMQDFLKTVFLTLLGCFAGSLLAIIVQIGTTVYFAGRMSEKLDRMSLSIDDHEARLRIEEKKKP